MGPISTVIETVLIILAWCVQLGITAALALLSGALLSTAERRIRRRKVRLFPRFFALLLILCTVLAFLAVKPPVLCPEEYQDDLTEEMQSAVQSQSRGLYSAALPLVPVYAKITDISGGRVYYRVQYLYFGHTEMSYSLTDGYNCEKSLLPT